MPSKNKKETKITQEVQQEEPNDDDNDTEVPELPANKLQNVITPKQISASILLLGTFYSCISMGPFYMTIFIYLLTTIGYYQMCKIQVRPEKEEKIMIKTVFLQWYFYFAYQFFITTQSWATYSLLYRSDLAPPKDSLMFKVVFGYHNLTAFCIFVAGIITFVISLEQGFYHYQFKQLGWILTNILFIVTGMHGFLSAMWYGRIWIGFPVLVVVINAVAAHFVNTFSGETPMMRLNPLKTVEGYGVGIFATMIFTFFSLEFFTSELYYTQPVNKLTFPPCVLSYVAPNQNLFGVNQVQLPFGLKENMIPAKIHLFVIALFGSVIVPFSSFFMAGLKRAFKVVDLEGSTIDRTHGVIVMGLFLILYVNLIVFKQENVQFRIEEMLHMMSENKRNQILDQLREHVAAATQN